MPGSSPSKADFGAALDFLEALGEASDLDDFAQRVALGFGSVIPCQTASYNEVNLPRRRVRLVAGLEAGPGHIEAFQRHLPEHPQIAHASLHPMSEATKMSDFVSLPRFRDMGLHREFYAAFGIENMLAIQISLEPMSIYVALLSDGADFSERDRAMLTLLRPHLANAYRNAAAMTDHGLQLALLEDGMDLAGVGAIMLTDDGRVRSITGEARRLLERYFAAEPLADRLPPPLADWLARASIPAADAHRLPLAQPLTVARDEAVLIARLLRRGPMRLILLCERRTAPSARALAALGLAPREAQVLMHAAAGRTDAEIADALSISPRTVSHTLEHVYRKLSVESRAAAVVKAMQAPEL